MKTNQWDTLLKQVIHVVKETGAYIRHQAPLIKLEGARLKEPKSLVTEVDLGAERMLVERLAKLLPEAGFLTEENTVARQDKTMQWIIDPLDGTTNFAYHIPFYGISVALQMAHETVIAVVYDVYHDDCFFTAIGGETYRNGKPVRVSDRPMQQAVIATGFPYNDYTCLDAQMTVLSVFIKESQAVRRLGAATLDLAYVACGIFDGFFEYSLMPWDVAAGALLVENAGGKVSDFSGGGEYLFGKQILAASPAVFDEMLTIIQNHFK